MSMKNPYEVLRAKEQEVVQVKRQIEALRIAANLLGDEDDENSLRDQGENAGKPVKLS
jgi:hypothetical protein